MKLFKKLLAIVLALCCVIAITACDENTSEEEYDTNKTGIALEYNVVEEDGKGFAIVTGLFLSDKQKASLGEEGFTTYDIAVGVDNKIEVVSYDEDNNPIYNENGELVTKFIAIGEEHDGITVESFKIAEAAFSNQTIIKSVKVASNVEFIGAGAFAGCSSLVSMELPFVGETAGTNLNAKKLFGHVFGTVTVDGCTSITSNYNTSGTATFYIPASLTEVVINYAAGAVLPEYAFNKITTLEKVTVNGAVSVGKNAFEGCSSLYNVVMPELKNEIGKSAFAGCAKLVNLFARENSIITFPQGIVIYQSAFSGCAKLGYKADLIDLSGATVYEKAFASCSSFTAIKFASENIKGSAVFSGCSSLETVTIDGTECAKGSWEFDDNGNIVSNG